MTRSKKKAFAAAIILGIVSVAALILMIPWLDSLYDPALREKFTAWVLRLGPLGFLCVLFLHVLQIVVAIIPGEPLELVSGALYGGVGGLILCLAGCAIGQALVFFLSRRFGMPLVRKFFKKKNLDRFKFLHDSKKLETVTFMLFLLPGTPKDMLTYLAGTTEISASHFLILSLFARIPSIASSTFIAAKLISGDWLPAAVITIVTGVLGLVGIICRDRFMAHVHRRHNKADSE